MDTDTAIEWHRYRSRIGFDGTHDCDLQTLRALIEHHARAIPFENIDTLAGRCGGLDIGALQSKMVPCLSG